MNHFMFNKKKTSLGKSKFFVLQSRLPGRYGTKHGEKEGKHYFCKPEIKTKMQIFIEKSDLVD